jgi:hypothetical protein
MSEFCVPCPALYPVNVPCAGINAHERACAFIAHKLASFKELSAHTWLRVYKREGRKCPVRADREFACEALKLRRKSSPAIAQTGQRSANSLLFSLLNGIRNLVPPSGIEGLILGQTVSGFASMVQRKGLAMVALK